MAQFIYFLCDEQTRIDRAILEKGALLVDHLQAIGYETNIIDSWDEPDYNIACAKESDKFNTVLVVYNHKPIKAAISIENCSDPNTKNRIVNDLSSRLSRDHNFGAVKIINQKEYDALLCGK